MPEDKSFSFEALEERFDEMLDANGPGTRAGPIGLHQNTTRVHAPLVRGHHPHQLRDGFSVRPSRSASI